MNDPLETLRRVFGYDDFRGRQREIIDHVIAGRHAMVIAPTGSGKSLCFQIPALCDVHGNADVLGGGNADDDNDNPLTLVLSPLVALMQDQVESLVARGVDAAFVNSLLDRDARQSRYDDIARGRYRLLYVTPERFRKDDFVELIARRNVTRLAIDEAHCVSQWGHDFRPDYSRVGDIRRMLGDPVTIALTATATAEVRRDIRRQLRLDDSMKLFHQGIARENLAIEVEPVMGDDEKYAAITRILGDDSIAGGSVILYFSLIKTLQHFSDRLSADRVDHVTYHGDLGRSARRRLQREFMDGQCDTVLATGAFGMGVDKPDIRAVVHVETPGSIESYYQEIGRAGRDGLPSRCLWLYDQADLSTQMQFIAWANPAAEYYQRVMDLLTVHNDQCRAFGLEWMNRRLQNISRHDHRLETVLAMLDRYGVIAGKHPPGCFDVIAEMPARFSDEAELEEKRIADQKRLYAMVQLAASDDRTDFLESYFLSEDA